MPTYKVVDVSQLDADLTSVANHIRTKGDASAALSFPSGFNNAIDAILTGISADLLETVTLNENSRSINIDTSQWYATYDFLLCFIDFTLSDADWLYVNYNQDELSGGSYTNTFSSKKGMLWAYIKNDGQDNALIRISKATMSGASVATLSNVIIYCYSSAKTILSGSSLKIYGGKYTDIL